MLRKLWAFYRRDLRLQLTYRIGFAFRLAHAFVSLLLFFSLEAVRQSLIAGVPLHAIRWELLALVTFSAVLFPAGLLFFRWAFCQARRSGSLGL